MEQQLHSIERNDPLGEPAGFSCHAEGRGWEYNAGMSQDADASEPPGQLPLQFSLRTLLIVQTLCAVFCALLMMVRIFAILILLLATVVYSWIPARPENLAKKRMVIDLLGGILLPILCFIAVSLPRSAILDFIDLGFLFQIATLSAWLIGGRLLGRAAGIVAGVLYGGAFVATVFSCLIVPFALLNLVFGLAIGLFTFTALLTTYDCVIALLLLAPVLMAVVYWRNAYAAHLPATRERTLWLGFALAFVAPLAASCFLGKPLGYVIGGTAWTSEWLFAPILYDNAPIQPL